MPIKQLGGMIIDSGSAVFHKTNQAEIEAGAMVLTVRIDQPGVVGGQGAPNRWDGQPVVDFGPMKPGTEQILSANVDIQSTRYITKLLLMAIGDDSVGVIAHHLTWTITVTPI